MTRPRILYALGSLANDLGDEIVSTVGGPSRADLHEPLAN